MRQLKITQGITLRDSEAINKYLSEIAKKDLVTAEQEVELAQRIRSGDKTAIKELVEANLRFVVSVAKQYQSKDLSLSDLISEGNFGLVKAATLFDETRGFKFISYAVWWIRQSILQAMNEKARLIRLPLNQIQLLNKLKKYQTEYIQEHQVPPSLDYLKDKLEITMDKLLVLVDSISSPASLDNQFSDDSDGTLLSLLENEDSPSADSISMKSSLSIEIERALKILPERSALILKYFFGIDTPALSLEEIAEKLDLTQERVRQVREKALARLRTSGQVSNMLRKYLG